MPVLYDDVHSQEFKSFEIYAVTIKISMTEYHHWLTVTLTIYSNSSLWGKWVW